MQLKECPSCGAMAGTHVPVCGFCGAAMTSDGPAPPVASTEPGPTEPGPTDRGPTEPGPTEPAPSSDDGSEPLLVPPPPPTRSAGRRLRRASRRVALGLCIVVAGGWFVVARAYQPGGTASEREALTGTGSWITFHDPNAAFTVDFPHEPSVGDVTTFESGTKREVWASVGRDVFELQYWDLDQGNTAGIAGENLLAQMPELFHASSSGRANAPIRTAAGGLPAIEFDVDAGDMKWSVIAVLAGHRVYEIAVGGPAVATGARARMVSSFHPLEPGEH